MADEKDEKTYHVKFKNGDEKRITVPADWKVTFGPCVVKDRNTPRDHEMPLALLWRGFCGSSVGFRNL